MPGTLNCERVDPSLQSRILRENRRAAGSTGPEQYIRIRRQQLQPGLGNTLMKVAFTASVSWRRARRMGGRSCGAGRGRAVSHQAVPDPEAALLPPNERRRSSDCVRWAVQVAQEAIAQSGLDPREVPTVFASSGGEMGVLDKLCRAPGDAERVISPTLFHQSVHNTAAGYWGIATTCQQSSTALSCYDDSFAAGLLEAVTFVCVEQRPVLAGGLRSGRACSAQRSPSDYHGICRRARVGSSVRLLARQA